MNKTVFLASALLLGTVLLGTAQAQLLGTVPQTVAQPTLQGFTLKGDTLTRAQATLKLDRVGERVVGVYVTAPKADTDSVARAILAAWGAPAEAVTQLNTLLNNAGFQAQTSGSLFSEVSADGSSAVHVRLRGDTWHAYTALQVYPANSFPPVSAPHGKVSAPARLDIISDYQCPYCNVLWNSSSLADWRSKPETYRIYLHHFPLPMHPLALPAATYGECAAAQGRLWEFSDVLNAGFATWTHQAPADALQTFAGYAAAAGVKPAELEACLAKNPAPALLQRAAQLGQNLNVRGTPTVYLNGVRLGNYNDASQIRVIREVTEGKSSAAAVIEGRLKELR